jgi:hypothetical protein
MKPYTPKTLRPALLILIQRYMGLTVHEEAQKLDADPKAVAEQAHNLSQSGEIVAAGTRYCSVIGCMSVTFYEPNAVEEAA